jgi:hypothetical protein
MKDSRGSDARLPDIDVRLLGRCDTVSRYEDPEAWLRTVAIGC